MAKLMIAMPTMGTVHTRCMMSLFAMDKPEDTVLMTTCSSLVYNARNYLYKQAVDLGCEAILWVDSDMIVPASAYTKLATESQELGVSFVTGLYFTKKEPIQPVLAKKLEWKQDQVTFQCTHNIEIYNDYPRDSVFPVEGAGFGCVYTKVDMLKRITKTYGSSPFEPIPGLGEDYSMCWKAKDLGYEMLCDSSVRCGHIGEYVFAEGESNEKV